MPDEKYLTKSEAAEYARLSEATIDRMRKSGQLKYIKVGKKVLVRRSDIDVFMAARVVKK
jgi:excisionase family DNA binding protein